MEPKKGQFNLFIQEALKSMSPDSDQKPVNIPTDDKTKFHEKVSNMQRDGYVDFSSGSGSDIRGEVELSGEARISPVDYVKWFSEISNKDVKTAGGKGASLGEMFNNKFPVPPGFVVTAQAFEYLINKAGLKEQIREIIKSIEYEDTDDLNKASAEIRKLIESFEIPGDLKDEILEAYHILGSEDIDETKISGDALTILKNSQEPIFVSIRSSATTEDLADASFAGQQETFLNVKGDGQLIEKVMKCFSSLYTPRAIYYRHKKGFKEEEALLAVVVQKMIDSEKSGVVFSKNPVGDEENVAIEAVFGLGEGIVGGKIKPDHYVVSRDLEIKNMKVADKKIAVVRTGSGENEIVRLSPEKSKSQVLSRGEIKEIADYAVKLEKHYNKPQDIEFALEAGEVYILQSRPITTLGKRKERGEIRGNVVLSGLGVSAGIGKGIVKIIKNMEDLSKIKKGDILVTEMTNPDMVVAMQKSSAIVTDEGGMTSHTSIVSREMGIPAVVGTENATETLKDGLRITVDGSSGKIYEGEVAETKAVEIRPAVETSKVKLKVIVDLPDFASRAAETELESVGLTRLEGMIASMKKHPLWYEKNGKLDEYSKIIEEGLLKIMEYFKSVWFRASDLRTDEYSSLESAPEKEINPMLGFHGVRFSLKHPEILKAELEAMKKVASANPDKKIGIMFPQVISIEEVREAKKYFNEVKLDNMEFGVMIETPASVQIIEEICSEVDFVSFGTNDLTQYSLAVDRNNEDVQYLYNELHPSIFSQIEKVIDVCNEKNVKTSICGQAGSKKEMVEFLFEKGIKSISVNADAAAEISELVKELEGKFVFEERERLEKERVEKEEIERLEAEKKAEKERIEKERLENERMKLEEEKREFEEMKREISKPVKKQIVEEKSVDIDNLSKEDLRKELGRLRRQRRWKDFNKLKKEMKKKGLWLDKKKDWDKKAQLGDLKFKDEDHVEKAEIVEDTKSDLKEDKESEVDVQESSSSDEEVVEQTREDDSGLDVNKKDRFLSDKQIEAELQGGEEMKENTGPIEPFGSTGRVENIGEEIQDSVQEESRETVEKEKEKIEVSGEEVEEKEVSKPMDEESEPSEEEKEEAIETEKEESKEQPEKEVGEISSEAGESEEPEEVGSDIKAAENIGVFNPDEDSKEKQKYKYNFDDWE